MAAVYGDGTISNPLKTNSDGKIQYDCSNTEVATVNEHGEVTLLRAGNAVITATIAATERFTSTKVSYALTVKPADISEYVLSIGTDIYDGNEHQAVIKLNGGDNLKEGSDYIVTGNKATNAGTYLVTVEGIGNYTGCLSENYTIKKAAALVSGVEKSYKKTFGDKQFQLHPVSDSDGTITFTASNKDVVTVSQDGTVIIVGAGDAIITVSTAETANYLKGETKVVVSVSRLNAAITAFSLSVSSDAEDFILKASTNSNGILQYETLNPDLLTIGSNGLIHLSGKSGKANVRISVGQTAQYEAAERIISNVIDLRQKIMRE